jgi:long-chain acyl-CoA synthetase
MPSALDLRIQDAVARLTAPGAMMALTTYERDGISLPMVAMAPPTLSAYFAFLSMQHGASEFIVSGDERLTFAQVYASARAIAAGLVAGHQVGKGDRVGIAMRNAPAWIAAYMGILMAGGVATLLNGWWQGGELVAGIEDVGCSLVICDAPRAARIAEAGYDGAAWPKAAARRRPCPN